MAVGVALGSGVGLGGAPAWAAPPSADGSSTEQAPIQPPVPLTPLTVLWPADLVADRDASPVAVDLLLTIDETGMVSDVQVVSAVQPFGAVAGKMAAALRFLPATEAGAPIPVQVPLHLVYAPPPVNLSGFVRGGAGEPLGGETVSAAGRTVVTRDDGSFAFRGLPSGPTEVRVTGGEERSIAPVTVTLSATEVADVTLAEPAPQEAAPVVGAYKRERAEVQKRAITAEQLRTVPGTMGDPLRAISNLPGAVRTPLDAGWLLVRGGAAQDTGVSIDGMPVPLIYHLGGFTSVVHPGFVQEVNFFPGGQSARYGRASAGIVDLVTNRAPTALDLRAGANIIHAGLYAAVPFQNGGIAIGARRSYLDWVLNAVPGVSDESAAIAPKFYDWEGKLSWHDLDVSILGYSDTISASNTRGQAVDITTGTQRYALSERVKIGDRKLRFQPYYGNESLVLYAEGLDLAEEEHVQSGGLRVETPDDGDGGWGWSAGVDTLYQHVRVTANSVQREGNLTSPEPYADLRIGDARRIVLGARLDSLLVKDQVPRLGFSPRISGVYPVGEALSFNADLGVYHQPPPRDLVVGPAEGSALELQYSYGGGVGATWKPGALQIEGSAYWRRLENETATEVDGTLGQGQGLAYGLETLTRYNQGRFSGWLTATWSRSFRREEPSLAWGGSTYDQPVYVVLIGAYDLGRGWTVASRFRYASGFLLPTEDDTPTAYDVFTQTEVPLEGDSAGRLPAYHALDVKISKHVLARHVVLDTYLDVQNVYNHRIPEPVMTGFPELVSEHYYGYGLPVLPILGIEGGFRSEKKSR